LIVASTLYDLTKRRFIDVATVSFSLSLECC